VAIAPDNYSGFDRTALSGFDRTTTDKLKDPSSKGGSGAPCGIWCFELFLSFEL
jgi:hypothetical protein